MSTYFRPYNVFPSIIHGHLSHAPNALYNLCSDAGASLVLDTACHQDGMCVCELGKLLEYYSRTVIEYNNGMGNENAS